MCQKNKLFGHLRIPAEEHYDLVLHVDNDDKGIRLYDAKPKSTDIPPTHDVLPSTSDSVVTKTLSHISTMSTAHIGNHVYGTVPAQCHDVEGISTNIPCYSKLIDIKKND